MSGGPARRREGRSHEAGMVTAETAVSLFGLVVLLLGVLWVVTLVGFQARCLDAARDTVRAAARGESLEVSRAEGRRSAPPGARIDLRAGSGLVTAVVSVDARPPWSVLSQLPAVRVEGRAVVAPEPGVTGFSGGPP